MVVFQILFKSVNIKEKVLHCSFETKFLILRWSLGVRAQSRLL